MEAYKVTAPLELYYGVIGLSDKQAALRPDKVTAVEGQPGIYAIRSTICFKEGEVIRILPDKEMLSKLVPVREAVEIEKMPDRKKGKPGDDL